MNEIMQNKNFIDIYNKSYRLAAAIFMISNVIDENEELRTKMKKLSLELVSMSVKLKDINFYDAQKILKEVEKNSLELMSMLDIAAVSGLISEMNGRIIKEEFKSFITEISTFAERFNEDKNAPLKHIFTEGIPADSDKNTDNIYALEKVINQPAYYKNNSENKKTENGNGHKRKDLRKNMIADFIKRHGAASIKDIIPNVTGCSEKTVQRELIELIKEGKVKKTGERRWSRYSII